MNPKIFNTLRDLVYEKSGIKIREGKEAMVAARIGKRMRAHGITKHREYLKLLTEDEGGEEITHLLDAISTNTTSFYREADHFKFLHAKIAEWIEQGQRRFRIWCAASSTGEEPYTLAMTLIEAVAGRANDVKILATDICTQVLDRARRGVYDTDKAKSIPRLLQQRYFKPKRIEDEECLEARPALKNVVVFKRLNLSQPPFPMKGPLDFVFCRNVMIYFDDPVRKRLVDDIYRLLKPEGYLVTGHAESLLGLETSFERESPSIYVKRA